MHGAAYLFSLCTGMLCRWQVDEIEDKENEITKVFAITRKEWLALFKKNIDEKLVNELT